MPETAADSKPAKAGVGQVFVCVSCSRTFSDRAAKDPVDVSFKGATVRTTKAVPHKKYPDDRDLDTLTYEDAVSDVKIPARDAAECCEHHVALCSAMHMRFHKEDDGTFHIIGAERLE